MIRELPFSRLVDINPRLKLVKGIDYPFVEMRDIDPGRRFARASRQRGFKSGGSRFRAGDTLFAKITPCLENGKIAQYKGNREGELAFGSTEFIVFRAKPDVADPSFVWALQGFVWNVSESG